jgi:hypothetical protein
MKENYTTSQPAVYVQPSQPVGAGYNPNPVYATAATATGYPASTASYPSNYNNSGGGGGFVGVNNPRPTQGRWRDDLCQCSTNCYPSCYCVCCCCWGYYLMAQSKFSEAISLLIMSFSSDSGRKDRLYDLSERYLDWITHLVNLSNY